MDHELARIREETRSEAAGSPRPSVHASVKRDPKDQMLADLLAAKVKEGTASAEEKSMLEGLLAKMEAVGSAPVSPKPSAKMPSAATPEPMAKTPSAKELHAEANLLGSKVRTNTATREEREKLDAVLARLEAVNAKAEELSELRSATKEAEAKLRTAEAKMESKIKESKIKEMMDSLKELDLVDLCFVLDATGSMGLYIREAKNKIMLIVKELCTANPMLSLRVAVSAYRDPLEPRGGENVVMDFVELTKEGQAAAGGFKEFDSFLGSVHEGGGGDHCEDIAGGIKNMLALSWSEQAPTKVLFHIGDAPCHGNRFHGPNVGDNHGGGDHGIIDLLRQVKSHNINYYFGKLTDHTDIMIQEFNKAMAGSMSEAGADFVQVAPLSASGGLVGSVTRAVRESLTISKKESKLRIGSLGPAGKLGGGVDMTEIDKALAAHGL